MELSQTADVKDPPDLDSTSLYTNRELSWMEFNERVLELAEDADTPLMERVKFLAIYSSNLDEFYMVRVAGLHDQVDAGIDARKADGLSPLETIDALARARRRAEATPLAPWTDDSARRWPRTASASSRPTSCSTSRERDGGRAVRRADLPRADAAGRGPGPPVPLHLQPVAALGGARPRPGDDTRLFARVKVPGGAAAPRRGRRRRAFVPLEGVIARHLDSLFPGMEMRRARVLPRDPRRRLRGLRRGRRPAARRGGRAAPRGASARSCAWRSAPGSTTSCASCWCKRWASRRVRS